MLESRAHFGGAVAQLGERRVRNAEVEGSIPFHSTTRSMKFAVYCTCLIAIAVHLRPLRLIKARLLRAKG